MKNVRRFLSRKTRKSDKGRPGFVFPAFILPEERVIFKTNPHWLCVVVPETALAILGVLIFKYLYPLSGEFYFKDWFPPLFGAAWAFVMIVIFLYWICIKYYLTNLRLIEERGIIGKRIMSIWLDKVQDVTCQFGILGRIFGFGDLEIQSAGTYGKIVFSFLPSPRKLRERIEEELLNFRREGIS